MKKIKNLNDYKEGDRITLVKEGPGFYSCISAFIISVKESKRGLQLTLKGRDIPTNWIQVEDNKIKSLDSAESERLVYENHKTADSIHAKKLRDYVPSTNVLKVSDDEPNNA